MVFCWSWFDLWHQLLLLSFLNVILHHSLLIVSHYVILSLQCVHSSSSPYDYKFQTVLSVFATLIILADIECEFTINQHNYYEVLVFFFIASKNNLRNYFIHIPKMYLISDYNRLTEKKVGSDCTVGNVWGVQSSWFLWVINTLWLRKINLWNRYERKFLI